MEAKQVRTIDIPADLISAAAEDLLPGSVQEQEIRLRISADIKTLQGAFVDTSEVLAVQRLLSLGARFHLTVEWPEPVAERVLAAASLFPTLCVLLLMRNAHHMVWRMGELHELDVSEARRRAQAYRFRRDLSLFPESEVVLVADSLGGTPSLDLYTLKPRGVRPKPDFEALLNDLLANQGGWQSIGERYQFANALGVVVGELFENTHVHARHEINGGPRQPDSIRGVMLRCVSWEAYISESSGKPAKPVKVPCFEVSVFDSGPGYFASYSKAPLAEEVQLDYEWKVLHNCLQRHYFRDVPDGRPSHTSLGLAEVARVVQALHGRIEIRTGRLYALRTFMTGELRMGMEERHPMSRKGVPEPVLFDLSTKLLRKPTRQKELIGASVRVLIPLGG